MKKNNALLLILAVSSIAVAIPMCSRKTERDLFDHKIINKFSNIIRGKAPLAAAAYFPVFIKFSDQTVARLSLKNLEMISKNVYNIPNRELDDFFFNALNQSVLFDKRSYAFVDYRFNPSVFIASLYRENGIKYLSKKYCIPLSDGSGYMLNSRKISRIEKETISYCFFMNKYFMIKDDYSASTSFKQMSKLGFD